MFTTALLALTSAALLVEGAALQPRAPTCPDLSTCNGNNGYADNSADGVRCTYLRYGPGPGKDIKLFRCYYNNNGDLVPSYTATDTSDGICSTKNTGTCPVATTTSVAPPPPSGTPPPPPNPKGRRINPNGNGAKCLDVQGAKFQNGTPVQIYDCNGTPAQSFEWNQASTKIRVAGTNFCLDAGSSPGNGIGMKIWTCYDNLPAQQFYRTDDLRFAVQNQGQCLDLTNGDLTNGRQSQTWQCGNGNTNQVWTEAYY